MRSIDIIVDRAGYEIQWGCLVWVPAVYTFHSRFLVQHPSGLSFSMALAIFVLSILGVLLNYAADRERDVCCIRTPRLIGTGVFVLTILSARLELLLP